MLSKHFSLDEFTHSGMGQNMGIDNTPNQIQISHLKALCDNVLEPIRAHYKVPVVISSGFRCPELNRAVGGAPDSQHLKGEAADVHIVGIRNDDLFNFIADTLAFDQVIAERLSESDGSRGWVHVSYSVKNRRDVLSCPSTGHYVKGLVYATS